VKGKSAKGELNVESGKGKLNVGCGEGDLVENILISIFIWLENRQAVC